MKSIEIYRVLVNTCKLTIAYTPGADPGFSFTAGAQKIICPQAQYERGTELSFGRGSRARLRALEALGLF